jgi:hypothetical protein
MAHTLSRVAAAGLAAASLGAALSVPASAQPSRDNCSCGGARVSHDVGSGNVTSGTDVAAPDQQNPIPPAAKPTVAAAPTWPENPQTLAPVRTVTVSAGDGFQWDDAGIGAGGALAIVLTGLGAVAIVRRRNAPDAPLAA